MEKAVIDSFKGDYAFLSNFCRHPFTSIDGLDYESSEAAYQAMKCESVYDRVEFQDVSAAEAKKLGRKVTLRSDWDNIKYDVMFRIVRRKFMNRHLAELLMQTYPAELVEGNYWHDTYWGVCNGVGENHLGKILMLVRAELLLKWGRTLTPQEAESYKKVLISMGEPTGVNLYNLL